MDVRLTEGGGQTAFRPRHRAGSRFPKWLQPILDGGRRHPRLAWGVALVVLALLLTWCYVREAQTYELNSDPAGQALQAWQLWHGNPLLRGWWLGDVNFYTVEIPLTAIIEKLHGLNPDDMHLGAGFLYMALVLLTALLARGRARGREGVVRALLGGGIMLAPSLLYGTRVLMQGPDHLGTMVPLVLMLLVLDRAPERWWVPVIVGLLLTLTQVSDPIATYAAAAALAVAGGVRVCSQIVRGQRPPRAWWYDASLVVAALVSIGLAHVILAKIHSVGGFYFPPPKYGTGLAPISKLPGHSSIAGYCALILFGADFTGHPLGVGTILALVHLVGVALACWGLLIGLRGFFVRMDRIAQILVVGIVIILAAGVLGNYMTAPVVGAHEIIPVLPFSAALAGRLLGDRFAKARLEWALAPVLAIYLGALAYNDAQPIATPAESSLASWLVAHHLKSGLAGYWESNITTLDSGGRVRVASVLDGGTTADAYESDSSWYNPKLSTANFIVSVSSPPADVPLVRPTVVRARFGAPARTYHFQQYTIMVYDYNLLTRVTLPATGGF